MEQLRKIIHIDMDAFYASIEQRDHPELRGKPVIVGGNPERRGVVATCSYEARRYGVHSAMPAKTAFMRCPHAIFVLPRFEVYRAVSAQIMQIFHDYTDLVEPLSLDEAFLDVTQNRLQMTSATHVAQAIKQQIYATTQLTASAGVSYNKFIAKLASDYHKPDGLTVIPPERAERFLEQLPIHKFFGVGKVTAARLHALGIENGADLKQMSEQRLRELFHKHGTVLYQSVRGEDSRPVMATRERKSVGKEITLLEDSNDIVQLMEHLQRLALQVEQRLKSLMLYGKTVTLKLRWSDFQILTRSISLSQPIQNASEMLTYVYPLLQVQLSSGRAVRLVGVTVSHLVPLMARSATPTSYNMHSLWDTLEE
jgi:Nucleotidyltransferase/DNA polymerase involved in DNA repair